MRWPCVWQVFFIMEISLLVLTGGCIIVGRVRFQRLRFLENYLSLDSVLLLVALAGAYIYLCFMLISSASTLGSYGIVSVLSLVTICVGLVQSTLQSIFVLDGLCRRADNDAQVTHCSHCVGLRGGEGVRQNLSFSSLLCLTSNIVKTLALLVCAGLFWCFP